jgi:hypothetical protein
VRAVGSTLLVLAASACAGDANEASVELRFTADPGLTGSEQYLCFGFDAALLDGADIGGIALDSPAGPVALHHLSLYASAGDFAAGPVECARMPEDAVPMNVWAPGGGDLVLEPDLALAIPEGTTRLVVQAHALRNEDGPAAERTLSITSRRDAVHRAGWMPLQAPTPALRPHHREESTASCAVAGDLHVISTWPHMHRVGFAFHGRAGAAPMIDVDPWVFDAQRAYPIAMSLTAGEMIETHCVWQNDTDLTILPGPSVDDEMCGQSLIAWPAPAAHCQ